MTHAIPILEPHDRRRPRRWTVTHRDWFGVILTRVGAERLAIALNTTGKAPDWCYGAERIKP